MGSQNAAESEEQSTTSDSTAESSPNKARPQQVEAFIRRVWEETGKKITRKHIWRALGHSSARQFQYWQSGSKRATKSDDRNFTRILGMKPSDFAKKHWTQPENSQL
jgi:hypothetical protein